jgi:hypothetical protein
VFFYEVLDLGGCRVRHCHHGKKLFEA